MRFDNIHKLEPDLEREIYRAFDHYLKHISIPELETRYIAIRRHARAAEIAVTANPKLLALPLGDWRNPWFWLRKELLTVEEFRLRGCPLPPGLHSMPINLTPRPAFLTGRNPGGDEFLVRYSKSKYLLPMRETGAVRITAASCYKAKENSEARLDDELHKHSFTPGEHVTITNPRTGERIPVIGNLRRTVNITNYYVLCMSNDFDPELFAPFESDSCLIIKNPDVFANRLENATRALLPGWHFNHFSVQYYDPYELERGQCVDPVAAKNFIFAYQKEYRFFWYSPEEQCANAYLDINVGTLKDIATFQPSA